MRRGALDRSCALLERADVSYPNNIVLDGFTLLFLRAWNKVTHTGVTDEKSLGPLNRVSIRVAVMN